jgi:hypothetical protein
MKKQLIDLSERQDIGLWCQLLNCDENHFIKAVMAIGNSPSMVDLFLTFNSWKKMTN